MNSETSSLPTFAPQPRRLQHLKRTLKPLIAGEYPHGFKIHFMTANGRQSYTTLPCSILRYSLRSKPDEHGPHTSRIGEPS